MNSLPVKPTHSFFPLRFSPAPEISESERQSLIEQCAYLRAQNRHFAPGHAVEDWLAAEAEIGQRLYQTQRLSGSPTC